MSSGSILSSAADFINKKLTASCPTADPGRRIRCAFRNTFFREVEINGFLWYNSVYQTVVPIAGFRRSIRTAGSVK
jgi:hypothetical protein